MTAAPLVPTPVAQRAAAPDVLRGVAILGILVMNVQSFAMPQDAYLYPNTFGRFEGRDFAVWLVSHILADQKFMAIFSMLFGAGMVLTIGRSAAVGGAWAGLHVRRMIILAGFGLVHAYTLWYGDILVLYAVCGLTLGWLVTRPTTLVLSIAGVLLAYPSVLLLTAGLEMRADPQGYDLSSLLDPPAEVRREIAAYRGGWGDQMTHRVPASWEMQTTNTIVYGYGRAGGMMLLGAVLWRWGVLSGERSGRTYALLLTAGLLTGLPTILMGVVRDSAVGWDPLYAGFLHFQFNYWGSIPVSLAWVAVVMLVLKRERGRRGAEPLRRVGRMALTNYLLSTVLATTLFYGHGLGLFGRVDRIGQAGIVVAIWAVLIVGSTLWLGACDVGPAEWLYRGLTYGRFGRLRKTGDSRR